MLEICVDSVESAINAQKGGADRIELTSSLCLGGLTPSIGMLKCVKEKVKVPVFCMIRPRHGNFVYNETELNVMREDIVCLKQYGADGFVFGALTVDGHVDKNACEMLIKAADPSSTTFHRAFDVSSNWKRSLEDIIDLGFTRILSSGQADTAIKGLETFSNVIQQAEKRIIVMVGSGVNENNIKEICKSTSADEYHGSASVEIKSNSGSISMGSADQLPIRVTCEEKVRKMKQSLNEIKIH